MARRVDQTRRYRRVRSLVLMHRWFHAANGACGLRGLVGWVCPRAGRSPGPEAFLFGSVRHFTGVVIEALLSLGFGSEVLLATLDVLVIASFSGMLCERVSLSTALRALVMPALYALAREWLQVVVAEVEDEHGLG